MKQTLKVFELMVPNRRDERIIFNTEQEAVSHLWDIFGQHACGRDVYGYATKLWKLDCDVFIKEVEFVRKGKLVAAPPESDNIIVITFKYMDEIIPYTCRNFKTVEDALVYMIDNDVCTLEDILGGASQRRSNYCRIKIRNQKSGQEYMISTMSRLAFSLLG
jgi:hypothetical protein